MLSWLQVSFSVHIKLLHIIIIIIIISKIHNTCKVDRLRPSAVTRSRFS